eukprot:scaffold1277_cov329-Prasinococcus_capsulatus_cf.AAC.1
MAKQAAPIAVSCTVAPQPPCTCIGGPSTVQPNHVTIATSISAAAPPGGGLRSCAWAPASCDGCSPAHAHPAARPLSARAGGSQKQADVCCAQPPRARSPAPPAAERTAWPPRPT